MTFTPPGEEPTSRPAAPPPPPPVPGWWLASDGNWYPPQAAPGAPPTGAPPVPYGLPQGSPYGYTYTPPPGSKTNGLAVASLVCGIVNVYFITSILAIIFGFVALNQIKASGGQQGGRGLAVAGITCAFAWIGLVVLIVVLVAVSS